MISDTEHPSPRIFTVCMTLVKCLLKYFTHFNCIVITELWEIFTYAGYQLLIAYWGTSIFSQCLWNSFFFIFYPKYNFLTQSQKIFFPMFASKNFIVVLLIFNSVINFNFWTSWEAYVKFPSETRLRILRIRWYQSKSFRSHCGKVWEI